MNLLRWWIDDEFTIDINHIDTVSWFKFRIIVEANIIVPATKSSHLEFIEDPSVSVVLSYTLK